MDTELLILAALLARDMYGREIQAGVSLLTDGKRKVSPGALYTTLHRMEKKGLISGRWADDSETREGARRRYYKVTGMGRRVLAEARYAINATALKPLEREA